MNDKGTSNTITSVQKDNLVVEPQIIKVGNYSPSGHNASSIVSTQGIAPAVMENHGPVTAIREPQVLTPKRTEFGKAIRKQDDSLAVMEGYNKEGCVQVGNIYPDSENMTNRSGGRVYSNTGCSPTILSRDFKQPKMIMEEPKIATMHYRIRKLTPRECFRLMGVDDADIDKLMNASISNSQLYKCAGNSIVVDVLYHIFRKLYVDKECEQENYQQTLF